MEEEKRINEEKEREREKEKEREREKEKERGKEREESESVLTHFYDDPCLYRETVGGGERREQSREREEMEKGVERKDGGEREGREERRVEKRKRGVEGKSSSSSFVFNPMAPLVSSTNPLHSGVCVSLYLDTLIHSIT